MLALVCLPLSQAPAQEPTSPFTSVCLSVGEDRASTRSLGQILSSFSCSTCNSRHTWVSQAQSSRQESLHTHQAPGEAGVPRPPGSMTLASSRGEAASSAPRAGPQMLTIQALLVSFSSQLPPWEPSPSFETLTEGGTLHCWLK